MNPRSRKSHSKFTKFIHKKPSKPSKTNKTNKKLESQRRQQEAIQQERQRQAEFERQRQAAMQQERQRQAAMQQERQRQAEFERQAAIQQERQSQEELRRIKGNLRIFSEMRSFWEQLSGLPWTDASTQSTQYNVDKDVFLINLNHGLIPLRYDNTDKKDPIKFIEYNSNVNQVKVLKAPIGSCPLSNDTLHHDLIKKLKQIPYTDKFHEEILSKISDEHLPENKDIHYDDPKKYLMSPDRVSTDRIISKRADKTYQTISVKQDNPTVNKYFTMILGEKDGGLYVLKNTIIALPFQSNIRMYTPDQLPQLMIQPILYSAGYIHFITSVEITIIIRTSSTRETYPARTVIDLTTDMYIECDSSNIHTHFLDMRIKSFLVDGDGNLKLYPYATGIQILDGGNNVTGIVRYEGFTDIQSCPYFIEYIQKMIQINAVTVENLDLYTENIITKCTSLTYPFEHETVFAINALMISNYFRNVTRLYTYDFTCQALTLVKVPDSTKYSVDDLDRILHDYPRVRERLYTYARGITKPKPKKKQKRTRKNK